MKLFAVVKTDKKFTAGLIEGTMIFDSDSVTLKNILFSSYAEISTKSQVKELNDFIPLVTWLHNSLTDILGSPLPYVPTDVLDEIPYDADDISKEILKLISIPMSTVVDKIWVNKKSVLVTDN